MESRWTPETSETDLRGQISMAYGVPYINGKLLKRRCLKWARIAHLDTETQVMTKRRSVSRTPRSLPVLTPDH
jgi:hypothetical protein